MTRPTGSDAKGYTLLEAVLAVALIATLTALAVPNLVRDIEGRRMPVSADQMRSLLTTVRSKAMYDGQRYRVRFPREDEIDSEGEERQPLVECEDDPFREPGVFNLVTEPWARGETFLGEVRCSEVRLGRPTLDELEEKFISQDLGEELEAVADEYEKGYPPLVFETDGTCEWATFVLTDAPRAADEKEVEAHARVEVILDGLTGLIWLQRPFFEEEIAMFKEHDWPPVLRKDFLRPAALTEEEVLEIQETAVRR